MKSLTVSLPVVLALNLGCQRTTEPEQAALAFYEKFKNSEMIGIPDQKGLSSVRPFLAPSLAQLIERARQIEDQFMANAEGPSPSNGWNLFYRNFEGATNVKVVSSDAKVDSASVVIECSYQEPGSSSIERWQLLVKLARHEARWLIEDRIPFNNGKPNHSESLRSELTKFCKEHGTTPTPMPGSPKS